MSGVLILIVCILFVKYFLFVKVLNQLTNTGNIRTPDQSLETPQKAGYSQTGLRSFFVF